MKKEKSVNTHLISRPEYKTNIFFQNYGVVVGIIGCYDILAPPPPSSSDVGQTIQVHCGKPKYFLQ